MMLTMMLTLTMCLPRQLLLPKPLGLLVVMLIAHDVGGDGDRGPAYHVYVDHKGHDADEKRWHRTSRVIGPPAPRPRPRGGAPGAPGATPPPPPPATSWTL